MRSAELRSRFTDFFQRHGHRVVPSAPLIPANDPTLMFTNAGMVQFKDVFVGAEVRDYTRATTAQKVMRVSGKHNDLEEVGRTTRHHTLFEMLGNFSFGDYFKELAIELAWKFVSQEVGMPVERIWVTVFGGGDGIPADTEARALWKKITGLPDDRIVDLGMKENFWSMGETGPCGPSSEIHLDTGSGPVTLNDFESGRVMEFWNLVFMQFQRRAKNAPLEALPAPSVDTGMGLERLTALLDGADSTFHTDAFLPVIEEVATNAKKKYTRSRTEDDVSLRVIADHARATAFLVADGLQPAKEGRGYVMRRIMRRAIRHGKRLGFEAPFFHSACDKVVDLMGEAYPELQTARPLIAKVVESEETQFRRTLDTGLKLLDREMSSMGDDRTLSGRSVFLLYDTYGFPKDLTQTIAEERGVAIDESGFKAAMEEQKDRSRGARVGDSAVAHVYKELAQTVSEIEFAGYPHESIDPAERNGPWRRIGDQLQLKTAVKALIQNGKRVESASSGEVEVVLDPTPFYGESGGQVGDTGAITADGLHVEIYDTQKPIHGVTLALGRIVEGELRTADSVWAGYAIPRRLRTRAHHSATHLVHAALRDTLGAHVAQAGSLNSPDRLRFDFSHFEATTPEQLVEIERNCNARVAENAPVLTEELAFDQAKEKGAIALFGEKYGDVVRVVTMGSSVELCGGTHARSTGEIEMILLTREESVSSGVRRLEAEVGIAAQNTARMLAHRLAEAAQILRGNPGQDVDGQKIDLDHPVLSAIQKSMRLLNDRVTQLGSSAPIRAHGCPEVPRLSNSITFDEARSVRDAWQALTRLTNAKPAEVDRVLASLEQPTSWTDVLRSYAEVVAQNQELERLLEIQRSRAAADQSDLLLAQTEKIGGIAVLAARAEGVDSKSIRSLADSIRAKMGSGVIALGCGAADKASLLIMVTPDLTDRFKAGELVRQIAPMIDGRGGGRADMAQAGGKNPEGFPDAFDELKKMIGDG